MKSVYVIQPYFVGSRTGRSLALIIPAKVVKECDIGTSTVFALRVNAATKKVSLQQTDYLNREHEKLRPAEQDFEIHSAGLMTSTGRFPIESSY